MSFENDLLLSEGADKIAELRQDKARLLESLCRLTALVSELPENGLGTVQGHELNAAYVEADNLVKSLS